MSNGFYPGLLDEIQVYDQVLSAAEVLSLYQTPGSVVGVESGAPVITSFEQVAGEVWELTLEGAAGASYQFRLSEVLDFAPGLLVENLAQGDPSDPGLVEGTNNATVTTDGVSGLAVVRLSLGGNPSSFIRAISAP